MCSTGSHDGKVYALNANTGQILWITTTGSPAVSSPVVEKGVVYAGSDDGKVYALNATSGQILWVTTTGSPAVSSPVVEKGVVYAGSDDGKVYALNATYGPDPVGHHDREPSRLLASRGEGRRLRWF